MPAAPDASCRHQESPGQADADDQARKQQVGHQGFEAFSHPQTVSRDSERFVSVSLEAPACHGLLRRAKRHTQRTP